MYTSDASKADAEALAKSLGIEFKTLPIQPHFDSYMGDFEKLFVGLPADTTEQNIQARIRGNLLMAVSNKLGHLVLATGNKSELATGYCTLYGDMVGGLGVISDVPKTLVYSIAREVVNRDREVIPQNTLTKAPSAELRHNQSDADDLPAYEVMDPILKAYVEEGKSPEEIVEAGLPAEAVQKTVDLVERNEYKRRQAPLGLRVTSKAFGVGRRYPIARKV
jgi:NAD+ synthetase